MELSPEMWLAIAGIAFGAISEITGLNPKWKSNSVIQILMKMAGAVVRKKGQSGKGSTMAITALFLAMLIGGIGMVGCSTTENLDQNVIQTQIKTKAYQIGLFVGQNNPDLLALATPYYEEIKAMHEGNNTEKFYSLVDTGLRYVISKYVASPLLQELILSDVKSLAALLGLDSIEVPDVDVLEGIDLDIAMAVVDQFMAGLEASENLSRSDG